MLFYLCVVSWQQNEGEAKAKASKAELTINNQRNNQIDTDDGIDDDKYWILFQKSLLIWPRQGKSRS